MQNVCAVIFRLCKVYSGSARLYSGSAQLYSGYARLYSGSARNILWFHTVIFTKKCNENGLPKFAPLSHELGYNQLQKCVKCVNVIVRIILDIGHCKVQVSRYKLKNLIFKVS